MADAAKISKKRQSVNAVMQLIGIVCLFTLYGFVSNWLRASNEDQEWRELGVAYFDELNQHMEAGDYQQVQASVTALLELAEHHLEPEHPEKVAIFLILATVEAKLADFERAEIFYRKALEILTEDLSTNTQLMGNCLQGLAKLYAETGRHIEALELFEESLRLTEANSEPDHLDIAIILSNFADLLIRLGDFDRAEQLLQRGLDIRRKNPENFSTAHGMHGIANFYQSMGDFNRSSQLLLDVIRVYGDTFGPHHPFTASAINSLALNYQQAGKYSEAESMHQRALAIQEAIFGQNHPATANTLGNLASAHFAGGRTTEAKANEATKLHERRLRIFEQTYGEDDTATAMALVDVALMSAWLGEYSRAIRLLERSLATTERANGAEHPAVLLPLMHLAARHHEQGNKVEATAYCRRALSVMDSVVQYMFSFTSEHQRMEWAAKQRFWDMPASLGLPVETAAAVVRYKGIVLDSLAEDRRLAAESSGETHARFSQIDAIVTRLTAIRQEAPADSSEDGWNRHQGEISRLESRVDALQKEMARHFASLGHVRQFSQVSVSELQAALPVNSLLLEWVQYLGLARQVRIVAIRPNSPSDKAGLLAGDIIHAYDDVVISTHFQLTHKIQATVGRPAKMVVQREGILQSFLIPDSYAESNRSHKRLGIEFNSQWENRFGVSIIPSSQSLNSEVDQESVAWISLGPVEEIERNLSRLNVFMRTPAVGDDMVRGLLRNLHEQIWEPIIAVIPIETDTIILSPDAELNFLSFATLLDPDGKFLGERYDLRYVSTGRDLVYNRKTGEEVGGIPETQGKNLAVFADPEFSRDVEDDPFDSEPNRALPLMTTRYLDTRDLRNINLIPLPGTRQEAEHLRQAGPSWGLKNTIFLDEHATKAEVQSIRSPHILHLATHGFILPKPEEEVLQNARGKALISSGNLSHVILSNPMHRSGLAFAGAQATLNAWGRGERPPVGNNGILNAADVAALDLKSTWLVVLSACDTGSGEARAGEGVLGLRRGFSMAGAQNLMITLWPVSDTFTVNFMTDFYAAAIESADAPDALAKVQMKWLLQLRKENGLADAVRLAGPFVLNTQSLKP